MMFMFSHFRGVVEIFSGELEHSDSFATGWRNEPEYGAKKIQAIKNGAL